MFERPGLCAMALAAIVSLTPCAASAEKNMALVIGNSAYRNAAKLATPVSDAEAVAQMFRDAGFESVDVALDADHDTFDNAVSDFKSKAAGADIAVVFFSGYSVGNGHIDDLLPVDAPLKGDKPETGTIPVDRVVSTVQGSKKLGLVMLDACRDNPFSKGDHRQPADVEPPVLIAYAMKAGGVCAEADAAHSLFTSAVLKTLTVPGLDIRLAFGRIRDDVMKASNARQQPFVYGSLGQGDYVLVPKPGQKQAADEDEVKQDYDLVVGIATKRAYQVFLDRYPDGFYSALVRERLKALDVKPK